MLNAAPLNSAPLNSVGSATQEPVYVVRGQAYTWRLRLVVGGVDVTAQLTGTVEVDREEGAAAVGSFDLHLAQGPVVPSDWVGRSVALDYLSTAAGETAEARRLTGRISSTTWNPIRRILSCECSDQLQQRVEGMAIADLDALIGGYWSADVFEPIEGRSHWDYALERLETLPASLDCSVTGELRVTSWFATDAAFSFGPGTTLYESVSVDLAPLGNITNRVEIEFAYRYPRLWQLNEEYSWTHPETTGLGGIQGFCAWRTWSTELPTTDMIESAIEDGGRTLVGTVTGTKLPLSMANPCGDGNAWVNTFDNLWLIASVSGATRWAQTVTENYKLTLATPEGEVAATQIIQRAAYTLSIEDDRADDWSRDPITDGETGSQDLAAPARRDAALEVALRSAQTEIIAAHRQTTLSWQVPTSLALGIDLVHTLELNDQGARGTGKCRRIVDSFDLGAGLATTTLSIAVMRGSGTSDALGLPAAPDTSLPPFEAIPEFQALPTQLGGRLNDPYTGQPIPPYDDEIDGFSGNYDATDDLTAETFPRRFTIRTREIGEQYRDERTAEAAALYRVGIPNDQLEL